MGCVLAKTSFCWRPHSVKFCPPSEIMYAFKMVLFLFLVCVFLPDDVIAAKMLCVAVRTCRLLSVFLSILLPLGVHVSSIVLALRQFPRMPSCTSLYMSHDHPLLVSVSSKPHLWMLKSILSATCQHQEESPLNAFPCCAACRTCTLPLGVCSTSSPTLRHRWWRRTTSSTSSFSAACWPRRCSRTSWSSRSSARSSSTSSWGG